MAKFVHKYDWIGLKTSWMMSKTSTLEEFFKEHSVPHNTWLKHTSTWHYERSRYREELGKQQLEVFKKNARAVVTRHSRMNQVAWSLLFGDLIQTKDDKGKPLPGGPRLKAGLTNSERIRLLELCQRHEIEMTSFERILAQMDVTKEDSGALNQEKAQESRRKLQNILKDPKAMNGAEAILDAIQEDPHAS